MVGKGNPEGKEEEESKYKYKLTGNVEEIKLLLENQFLMKIINFINNNKIIKTQTKKDLQLKTIIKMNEFKSQYKFNQLANTSQTPNDPSNTDEIDMDINIKCPILILPYFHPQYQRNVEDHALNPDFDDKNHFLFVKFGDIHIINTKYHPESLDGGYLSFNHIVNPFHDSVDISPMSSAPSPFTSSYNLTVQNIQLFIFNSILPVRIFPFFFFFLLTFVVLYVYSLSFLPSLFLCFPLSLPPSLPFDLCSSLFYPFSFLPLNLPLLNSHFRNILPSLLRSYSPSSLPFPSLLPVTFPMVSPAKGASPHFPPYLFLLFHIQCSVFLSFMHYRYHHLDLDSESNPSFYFPFPPLPLLLSRPQTVLIGGTYAHRMKRNM